MRHYLILALFLLIAASVTAQPVQWTEEAGGNGHFYLAVPSDVVGLDWSDARVMAEGMGGYLATVTSAEDNEWIWLNLGTPEQHYLGGHRSGTGWAWITGEPWSFTAWAPWEPNNANGGEPYLEYAHNMDWNDVGDLDLGIQGFIVEWDEGVVGSVGLSWGTLKADFR